MNKIENDCYTGFLANTGSNVNIVLTELQYAPNNVKTYDITTRVLFEAVRELDTRLKALENK